jgi:hypothetical protein
MERFCGSIARANKSRRYPFTSINRHVLQLSQLSQIKLMYGLSEVLNLDDRRSNLAKGTQYDGYDDLVFVSPEEVRTVGKTLLRLVSTFISHKLKVSEQLVRNELATRKFTAWGKMQRIVKSDTGDITGGDLFRGHDLAPELNRQTRDASHAQVSH